MKSSLTHKTILLLLLIGFTSCSSKKEMTREYTIINLVLDSLVKQSRKDSIGLQLKTLNDRWFSEELILHPGFNYYQNGEAINKCLENNIASKRFSNFNYKAFKANDKPLDISKITNTHITTNFQTKKIVSQEEKKLKKLLINEGNLSKEEAQRYIWEREQSQPIYIVSKPIFSDDSKIAVVFVVATNRGVQSWTLKPTETRSWSIFCVEQITIE